MGNVYKGPVTRVLPGMEAAFVDIGLERDAFLFVSDVKHAEPEKDREPEGEELGEGEPSNSDLFVGVRRSLSR